MFNLNSVGIGAFIAGFWLDNVYCQGTETDLSECRHNGWGIHDCGNEESAGVICASVNSSSEEYDDYVTTRAPPTTSIPRQRISVKNNH